MSNAVERFALTFIRLRPSHQGPVPVRLTPEFSCGAANVIYAAGVERCAAPAAATIR
jgi:hypothetical protein